MGTLKDVKNEVEKPPKKKAPCLSGQMTRGQFSTCIIKNMKTKYMYIYALSIIGLQVFYFFSIIFSYCQKMADIIFTNPGLPLLLFFDHNPDRKFLATIKKA